MRQMLAVLLGFLLSFSVFAAPSEPLPVNKAFVFSSYVDPDDNVVFFWAIAPGYYLYQDKVHITFSPTSQIKINPIVFPKSKEIEDLMGTKHAVYTGLLKIRVPVVGDFRGPLTLTVSYQGCSLNGFCYTPVKKYLNINETSSGKKLEAVDSLPDNTYSHILNDHNLFFIVLSFLGLGLLLAFTPCVLPVIPILSSIILGKKNTSTAHNFTLSFMYVLGMSLTYAIAGVLIAMLGQNLQVIFQKPWIIVLFSALFVFLSISLFGLFDLRLPGRVQRAVTDFSMKQKSGTYAGVFLMGCLSTLIVSPCVSPPLVGVLAYVAQTGNILLGAASLFALGLGMGIPLLLIGASLQKWLPKSGAWMDWIKKILSVLMLGVAFWMLSRVFSISMMLLIWSVSLILFSFYSIFLYQRENADRKIFQIIGSLIGLYGVMMVLSVSQGYINLLKPWEGVQSIFEQKITQQGVIFHTIRNMSAMDEALLQAQKNHQPVMIDFYADWCSSCVILDKMVFSRKDIANALHGYQLLRVDVTDNNDFDQVIMQRWNIIAPPTILFFDAEGQELTTFRITGEIDAENFLNHIKNIEEKSHAESF